MVTLHALCESEARRRSIAQTFEALQWEILFLISELGIYAFLVPPCFSIAVANIINDSIQSILNNGSLLKEFTSPPSEAEFDVSIQNYRVSVCWKAMFLSSHF